MQSSSHLQTIWLDAVERAKHAVQTGEDTQYLLCLGPVPSGEEVRLHTAVNGSVEGDGGRPGFIGGAGLEIAVALHVEGGDLLGNVHERAQIRACLPRHDRGEAGRVVEHAWLGRLVIRGWASQV